MHIITDQERYSWTLNHSSNADGPPRVRRRLHLGGVWCVHRVSSSLLGPVDLSFRSLSGRVEFTVQRHTLNNDFPSHPKHWALSAHPANPAGGDCDGGGGVLRCARGMPRRVAGGGCSAILRNAGATHQHRVPAGRRWWSRRRDRRRGRRRGARRGGAAGSAPTPYT